MGLWETKNKHSSSVWCQRVRVCRPHFKNSKLFWVCRPHIKDCLACVFPYQYSFFMLCVGVCLPRKNLFRQPTCLLEVKSSLVAILRHLLFRCMWSLFLLYIIVYQNQCEEVLKKGMFFLFFKNHQFPPDKKHIFCLLWNKQNMLKKKNKKYLLTNWFGNTFKH